mgnify:CR=1 FL=1
MEVYKMKIKNVLIASDFDGTLKNDEGIITPDVIEKIQYFIKVPRFVKRAKPI